MRFEDLVEAFKSGLIENDDFAERCLDFFKDMNFNFIAEVGALCALKLIRKGSSKTDGGPQTRDKAIELQKVPPGDFFKSFPRMFNNSTIRAGTLVTNPSELWKAHVERSAYSTIPRLPDWFCAYATLSLFHHTLTSTDEILNELSQSVLNACKESFEETMVSQGYVQNMVFFAEVEGFFLIRPLKKIQKTLEI